MLIKVLILFFSIILFYQLYLAIFRRKEGMTGDGGMFDDITGTTGSNGITGSTGITGTTTTPSLFNLSSMLSTTGPATSSPINLGGDNSLNTTTAPTTTTGDTYSNYTGDNVGQITYLTNQNNINTQNIAANTTDIKTLQTQYTSLNNKVLVLSNKIPPS
jgi:hypothetical protein